MKVEFANAQPYYFLRIIAEDRDEAEKLAGWDNCVLSAKFDYLKGVPPRVSELLIVKKI